MITKPLSYYCPLSTTRKYKEHEIISFFFNFHYINKRINSTSITTICTSGREGTIGCLLHKSPKFYNIVFLFVGLRTLETFIKFWVLKLSQLQTFRPLILIYIILRIIISEGHQFIGHCLIPLDLCMYTLNFYSFLKVYIVLIIRLLFMHI